jgi:hypothetical protein
MEFFIVLTLARPSGSGVHQCTIIRTVTAKPGSTRSGLLSWAFTQAPAEMRGANVLFFSAEPNALPFKAGGAA